MQQIAQGVEFWFIKERLLVRARCGTRLQDGRAAACEVPNDVAHGLGRAAEGGGNISGLVALRGGEDDLGAAQGKGIFGAEGVNQRRPLAGT